ncbi:rare lipoprotein A [Rhodomicrobium vannielii ATCC 17100]|jgi:rare lipoprotein A|uniref:Endolytic peptidoglycan transglycosylase RlpA n=1 Tax=Rhodomicrobium vannielii (strain ATCC 17100 / DSM 162 / LMG 4299 / NCIMB 10020 / ATH 3.1.1) TaxID=648757 RepID=E3I0K7_RHOVT|nr:rare lipoprotein A [Rhodomicrobium vannielii ATCC 17100]
MNNVKRIRAVVLMAAMSLASQQAFAECGIASTYSEGSRTANGEAYNHMGISAAHKTLPFGSRVVVRNQRTGRSITVRINDRGPFVGGRIIDLSTGAKNALGMDGLAPVCLEVVSFGSSRTVKSAELREPVEMVRSSNTRTVRVRNSRSAKAGGKARYAKSGKRSRHAGSGRRRVASR